MNSGYEIQPSPAQEKPSSTDQKLPVALSRLLHLSHDIAPSDLSPGTTNTFTFFKSAS
jgi:hypothetical protein